MNEEFARKICGYGSTENRCPNLCSLSADFYCGKKFRGVQTCPRLNLAEAFFNKADQKSVLTGIVVPN